MCVNHVDAAYSINELAVHNQKQLHVFSRKAISLDQFLIASSYKDFYFLKMYIQQV